MWTLGTGSLRVVFVLPKVRRIAIQIYESPTRLSFCGHAEREISPAYWPLIYRFPETDLRGTLLLCVFSDTARKSCWPRMCWIYSWQIISHRWIVCLSPLGTMELVTVLSLIERIYASFTAFLHGMNLGFGCGAGGVLLAWASGRPSVNTKMKQKK